MKKLISKFQYGGRKKLDMPVSSYVTKMATLLKPTILPYGGGHTSGGGAGGQFREADPEYLYDMEKQEAIPVLSRRERFDKAFAEARKQGLKKFEFEGGIYTTDLDKSGKWKPATSGGVVIKKSRKENVTKDEANKLRKQGYVLVRKIKK